MELDTTKLYRVAQYRLARLTLRHAGMWSLFFGVLSVVAGCIRPPVDWVLTVLGVVLMGSGAWNIRAPRPTSMVFDALTLLLVGAYNLLGAIGAVMDGLPPAPHWAFLGVLQLVWSVKRLGNLGQFANAFLERPPDSQAQEIEQGLWSIRRALATGTADTIELLAGVRPRAWKARLTGEHAIFVEVEGPGLLVGTRRNVTITPSAKGSSGAAVTAELTVGQTRNPVTLSPDALRTFQQWKRAEPVARSAAA